MFIFPYKINAKIWAFDDPIVDLNREPFVLGISEMIDKLTQDIPNAEDGFYLIFSENEFPQYDVKLDHIREESGGNWYKIEKWNMEGWLCPALFKYFDVAPQTIYVKAQSTEGE